MGAGSDQPAGSARTVTVVGVGRASLTPDRAVAEVAVIAHRRRMGDAFAEVAAGVSGVEAIARRHELQVASQSLRTQPSYDDRGRPDGFECHHQLRVSCPSIAVASGVLGELVEELGDSVRIHDVDLLVSDAGAAAASAREAAYAEALEAARQLAELAGAELGAAMEISELDSADGEHRPVAFALAAKADAGLVPGEHDVSIGLRVAFALL